MTSAEQGLVRERVEIAGRTASRSRLKAFRLANDDAPCPRCGIHMLALPTEIDHIIPLELGGVDDETNWQVLCVPCHREKTREDIKRIRKAARLRRDADPETRRKSKRPIRSRGFEKADELKP